MSTARVGIGALLLAVSALGCGAGGNGGADGGPPPAPATCAIVQPCGGDITGTWKVLGGCTDGLFASGLLTCLQYDQLLAGVGYSGTLTFNSDMTYTTSNFVQSGTGTYTIPNSCLPAGVTCDSLNRGCSGASDCTCSGAGLGSDVFGGSNISGTYHFFGNEVILTFPDGTETGNIYYCVQNDILHLETYVTLIANDGSRTTPVTDDVVAQKQ